MTYAKRAFYRLPPRFDELLLLLLLLLLPRLLLPELPDELREGVLTAGDELREGVVTVREGVALLLRVCEGWLLTLLLLGAG